LKKRIIIFLIITVLTVFVSSCSNNGEITSDKTAADSNSLGNLAITLKDGDGMTDGVISVEAVANGSGKDLYYVISDSAGEIPGDGVKISSVGGELPLTLNTEIGSAVKNNSWLRVYDVDGENIVGFVAVKITYDKIGNLLVGPLGPIDAQTGMSQYYGDASLLNYSIEAVVSDMKVDDTIDDHPEWANIQFRLRETNGQYYYLYIDPNGSVNLQDSITWGQLDSAWIANNPSSEAVSYKIVADDNTFSVYSDGELLYTSVDDRNEALLTGRAGWAAERGASGIIDKFTLKRVRKESDGDENAKLPVESASVHNIKAPVAGVYPQGIFKYSSGTYSETLEWSPHVSDFFKPDTVYTATVILEPNSIARTFKGVNISDIGGLPTDNIADITSETVGDNLEIKITFNKTASETVPFGNMIFEDNFDGDSLDLTKWRLEDEQYRQGRSYWSDSMTKVENGSLVLGIQRDSTGENSGGFGEGDKNFVLSGAVSTRGVFTNTYGYYEANIKFPVVSGTWGAFWMYGDTVGGTDYQGVDGTEIDIVESIGNDKGESSSNLHWDGYGDAHKTIGSGSYSLIGYASPTGIYDGEWHKFAMDWSPDYYIFYIDDKEMWRVTNDSADKNGNKPGICQNPLHIIFSVEGAEWAGNLPSGFTYGEMLVDYVRVYDQPKFIQ